MKYRQGEIFKTIGELADWLASGKSVYMRNKYLHFGWVSSMQLRYLMQCVERGVVVQALPNKEKEDERKVEDRKD